MKNFSQPIQTKASTNKANSQRTQESRNLAGDLAEIAARMGQLKGDASAYLTDPNCSTLGLRLQNAYAAAEAAAVGARRPGQAGAELGEILITEGKISSEQLEEAPLAQRKTRER
jgi:hypothetical protein